MKLSTTILLLACQFVVLSAAHAATTTYTTAWSGGVIAPGDTAVVENGGSITGNVTADGTLQFNQTTSLTVTGTISGTGGIRLTNSGTVALAGVTSGTGRYDLSIVASAGELAIGSTGTNGLILGTTGTGSLAIHGGTVRNGIGILGFNAGSSATATVSSGTWANAAGVAGRILYVGHSGGGMLDVAGGFVTNATGYVGFNAGSVGTVSVRSGTWQNRGQLYVGGGVGGTGGVGELTVSGGNVTSTFGYLGANTTGVGTALITGGTWSLSSNLNVGTSGTGTLTISGSGGGGGTVIVGGTLARGASGTINLSPGGTLQIGTGTTASGGLATDLVNNGSLVFNRTGAATVANTISGSGSLALAGSGTITFSGSNTFTGPTAVNAGALSVTGAFGTSAVSVNPGGRLLGSGTLGGAVAVAAGGVLSPGVGIESLAVGATSLFDGSAFVSELNSTAPLSAAADLLTIAGNLSLSGTVNLVLLDLAVTPAAFPAGTTLSLASYTGGWNGGLFRFDGSVLADGDTFAAGEQLWAIDYDATLGGANFSEDHLAGGNFVNLVAVPEPSALATLGIGLAGGAVWLQRRRTFGIRR